MTRIPKYISPNGLGAEVANIAGNMKLKRLARNVYLTKLAKMALLITKRRPSMSKVRLTMELPKVGDRLVRVMTATSDCLAPSYQPRDCIVTFVNERHHWYQVTFTDTGAKECYGVPVTDHSIVRPNGGSVPVICIETGIAYSSIAQCARDMRLKSGSISNQMSGFQDNCSGYHFIPVL